MPRVGRLAREMRAVERDIAALPRWMRRESGAAEESLFLVQAHRWYGGSEDRQIGIIAFDHEEARTKVRKLLDDEQKGRWQAAITIRLKVSGFVAIIRAAFVLQQVGIKVYEIHEKGREEVLRVCEAEKRIAADPRIGLGEMGSPK